MHPSDLNFLLLDGSLLQLDLLLLFKHGLPLELSGYCCLRGSLCLRIMLLLLGRCPLLRDLFLFLIVIVLIFLVGCSDISLLLRGGSLLLGGGVIIALADLVAHSPFKCDTGHPGGLIRSRGLVQVEVKLDGFMIGSLLIDALLWLLRASVNILLRVATGRHGLWWLPLGDSLLLGVVLLGASFLPGPRLLCLLEVKLPLIVHLIAQVGREEDKGDGDEGCDRTNC